MPTLQPWRQHRRPAGAALHRRAQPLLPPGRPERAAAALSRPVRARGGRPQADPDQDRRRRDRPAVPPPVLQGLHLPQGERAAQRPAPAAVAGGPRRASGALPQPQRQRPGLARAVPRPALPRGAVARHRSRRCSASSSMSAWRSRRTTRSSRRARCIASEYGQRCIAYDPEAADRLLDELGLDRRDRRGVRLLPDGRPMELMVETAGEDTEQVDVLELVRDQWREIGVRHPRQAVRPRDAAQPHLRRRDADDDLLRHRQRHADRGHAAAASSRRRARPIRRSGRNGASTTRPRVPPASRRTCPRPSG